VASQLDRSKPKEKPREQHEEWGKIKVTDPRLEHVPGKDRTRETITLGVGALSGARSNSARWGGRPCR